MSNKTLIETVSLLVKTLNCGNVNRMEVKDCLNGIESLKTKLRKRNYE